MSTFYSLKVAEVKPLTPNSVAISLQVPQDLKEKFRFQAGQHLTIKQKIDGKEVRRSYSISSDPKEDALTIGIKKVEDGVFSTWANEHIKVGNSLEVMPPTGHFIYPPKGNSKHIAAFAAGSGITPIMSIAVSVLDADPGNTFVLVYGNQSPEETMYLEDIQALISKYTNRFFTQFLYSRTREDDALFGRIDGSIVNLITKNKFKDRSFDHFYLCGPEDMINTVKETLKENGVEQEKIHFELFTTSQEEDISDLEGQTQVEVTLDDEVFSLVMDKKKLVLDAVLEADIDAPYSCQGGVCSTCIARVIEGKAEMVKNQILTDSEIEEGFILTCQSHPLTPTLKIDYDDV
ncbi:ferredoxin--NADP reductase [Muriicola jejuensis]|uniref:2Fe-2S iron-sulfur cluster binding domain-containing protein n=1 Tax=Muriicola jejuensis TaxID=504488 RepID=A0A6P0U9A9_9FLAO|nr:ferredoxin--NADP reductase [Muriicola jejuensis]NER09891.1 2Fe-2S iron-sulfur cluster binding domain-containing protein [Muriicola jejuensis]